MNDFTEAGEDPIMTYTGYQWLSVMVAGMVVPATMMTPWVFRKLGVAGTCVFGNLFTALLTFGLLMIGNGVSNIETLVLSAFAQAYPLTPVFVTECDYRSLCRLCHCPVRGLSVYCL
jgi:hypothetical protein